MIPPSPEESTAPSSLSMIPPVHIRSGLSAARASAGPVPWMPPAITSLYQTSPRA